VTFGLESFAVGVDAKAAIWAKLGVVWRLEPISPNYGKPVVRGVFESVTWVGGVTAWITGEAELVTVRLADGWNVNKHYDLASPGDLEIALDELAALIAQGSVPDEAVTAWDTRGAVARASARSPELHAPGGRVGGLPFGSPPLSEPCLKLVVSHGSSSPRVGGRALCQLAVSAGPSSG
jgi:hypothetical protein